MVKSIEDALQLRIKELEAQLALKTKSEFRPHVQNGMLRLFSGAAKRGNFYGDDLPLIVANWKAIVEVAKAAGPTLARNGQDYKDRAKEQGWKLANFGPPKA